VAEGEGVSGAPPAAPSAVSEDYLKAILAIEERDGTPTGVTELARRLGLSVSAVSGMVRRLDGAGLVRHRRYGRFVLTPEGRRAALGVVRRHRLIEAYLVAELGFGWDDVHEEAEVLEHAVSGKLLEAMAERLGYPSHDPHGDPIPDADGNLPVERTQPLSSLAAGSEGRLVRVLDAPAELLRWLSAEGVALGDTLRVVGWDPSGTLAVRLSAPDRELRFGPDVAGLLRVVCLTQPSDEPPGQLETGNQGQLCSLDPALRR
jgi:DtxR family Mn-dependent transcriptional regulator